MFCCGSVKWIQKQWCSASMEVWYEIRNKESTNVLLYGTEILLSQNHNKNSHVLFKVIIQHQWILVLQWCSRIVFCHQGIMFRNSDVLQLRSDIQKQFCYDQNIFRKKNDVSLQRDIRKHWMSCGARMVLITKKVMFWCGRVIVIKNQWCLCIEKFILIAKTQWCSSNLMDCYINY